MRHDLIAHDVQVSATPVREALVGLSKEGFVRHESGRGFVVSPLLRSDLEDIYDLQAQVAARLAERAAIRITPRQFDELAHVQATLDQAVREGAFAEVERLNDVFHRIINRAADSSKLAWALVSFLKYVPKNHYADISGMSDRISVEHGEILEAMRDRDTKAAHVAMYEHSAESMQDVLKHLNARGVVP